MKIGEFLNYVHAKSEAYDQARALYAHRLAPQFSLFEFMNTSETGLSRILAWLLDPDGSHAQGERFLAAFLAWLKLEPASLLGVDWGKARVRTEVFTNHSDDYGFIDILVEAGGVGIAIENKPSAIDQARQVERYLNDLDRRCPGGQFLLYLSGDGNPPADYSIAADRRAVEEQAGRLFIKGYADLVPWLEACRTRCQAAPVTVMIDGFIMYIQRRFEGIYDMDDANDLAAKITGNPAMLEAALTVIEAEAAVKSRLIAKFIADVESRIGSCPGWKIGDRDLCEKVQSRLGIRVNAKPYQFALQVEQKGFGQMDFGVRFDDDYDGNPQLMERLRGLPGGGWHSTARWPMWKTVGENDQFFNVAGTRSSEFWLGLHSGVMADRFVDFVRTCAVCLESGTEALAGE